MQVPGSGPRWARTAPGEGQRFGDRHRGSHGSPAKGLLAACLLRNASCERLFSGERGGRWRGGLTLSLRAASRLPAARPLRAVPCRAGQPGAPPPGPGRALPRDKLALLLVMTQDGEPQIVFYLFIIYFNFIFLYFNLFLTQDSKAMVQQAASLSRSSLLV